MELAKGIVEEIVWGLVKRHVKVDVKNHVVEVVLILVQVAPSYKPIHNDK